MVAEKSGDMAFQCAGTLKPRLESGPIAADLTTTVVYSYKLLEKDVKPNHSEKVSHFYVNHILQRNHADLGSGQKFILSTILKT